MSKLKHVEQIRQRIQRALEPLRQYVIMTQPDNLEIVDRLRGDSGAEWLAGATDQLLESLGHPVSTPADSRFSKSKRAANRRVAD